MNPPSVHSHCDERSARSAADRRALTQRVHDRSRGASALLPRAALTHPSRSPPPLIRASDRSAAVAVDAGLARRAVGLARAGRARFAVGQAVVARTNHVRDRSAVAIRHGHRLAHRAGGARHAADARDALGADRAGARSVAQRLRARVGDAHAIIAAVQPSAAGRSRARRARGEAAAVEARLSCAALRVAGAPGRRAIAAEHHRARRRALLSFGARASAAAVAALAVDAHAAGAALVVELARGRAIDAAPRDAHAAVGALRVRGATRVGAHHARAVEAHFVGLALRVARARRSDGRGRGARASAEARPASAGHASETVAAVTIARATLDRAPRVRAHLPDRALAGARAGGGGGRRDRATGCSVAVVASGRVAVVRVPSAARARRSSRGERHDRGSGDDHSAKGGEKASGVHGGYGLQRRRSCDQPTVSHGV